MVNEYNEDNLSKYGITIGFFSYNEYSFGLIHKYRIISRIEGFAVKVEKENVGVVYEVVNLSLCLRGVVQMTTSADYLFVKCRLKDMG